MKYRLGLGFKPRQLGSRVTVNLQCSVSSNESFLLQLASLIKERDGHRGTGGGGRCGWREEGVAMERGEV